MILVFKRWQYCHLLFRTALVLRGIPQLQVSETMSRVGYVYTMSYTIKTLFEGFSFSSPFLLI